jgi:dUTP pyrophosphatase
MINSLKFSKLHANAKLPTRGSQYAAGLDLYCVDDFSILPGARTLAKIGLAVAIPQGFYGRIAPRSSLAADYGINVLAGVIDSDYRGEIICILVNHGEEAVHIKAGTRIAQLILESIVVPMPEWADDLDTTERDIGGFGSTGNL